VKYLSARLDMAYIVNQYRSSFFQREFLTSLFKKLGENTQ